MYVLDSNALIELMIHGPKMNEILEIAGEETPFTTSICVHEVLVGVESDKQRFIFEGILSKTRVLEHDVYAARAGANIEKDLTRRGKKIARADILIAGICKANNAELITLDKDFARISNFKARIL